MKRISLLLLSVLSLCCGLWAEAPRDIVQASRPAYATDLVKVKISAVTLSRADLPTGLYAEASRSGDPELDRFMVEIGGTALIRAHRRVKDQAWEAREGFDRWFLLRLDGKLSAEEALAACKASPLIEDASFEHYAYTQFIPNDNYYAQNWGHNNTGQGPGGGGAGFDSNAPEAWDQQQQFGSPDIIIAIIDSGVNYNHPDLNDNCVPGYDYGQNDDDPMDTNGHGSQCAGVAAGETNNAMGVAGVAGGCSIMPVKVMSSSGSMTFTAITNGITHAADHDANVISMSLGAENGADEGDNPACDAALYYAFNAGCVILAATANSDDPVIAYPSNHTAVISVGAASPTGQRKSASSSDGQNWWGSNYGVNIQDDPKAVDIMAATILPATTRTGTYSTDFNGTSCATPYAAGVAGLILSKDPGLTPNQVRQAMVTGSTDMTIDGGVGWDRYTGYGMVNAEGALATVAPGMPTCVITYPENDDAFYLGSAVNVSVNSSDSNGSVTNVTFYVDNLGVPLHLDDSAPYEWTWNTQGQTPGPHTIWAMTIDNENNTRRDSVDVVLLIPAHEGFESGLFDLYPWNNQNPTPWTVQAEECFTGDFAAKAGAITHNQESTLSLTLNITEAGEISFFSKVSCEPNYDFFRFFIDGAQQEQWTGNVDWGQHAYPVGSGQRTFTWTYFKDQGVNSGSDTAWLDHIVFPSHNAPPFAPSNLTATAVSPTRILLSWTDNSSDETEFYVESQSGGFWSLVDWTGANVTSVVTGSLNPQTNYSFRVRAYNANGGSNYSNVASALTLGPDCPDNVTAVAGANLVNLSWTAPVGGCDGYEIWRFALDDGEPDDGVCLTPTPVTGMAFTDQDWHLQSAGDYLWEVMAVSSMINSAPSLSNFLHKVENGIILGTVTNLSGVPIINASVGCGTLSSTTNEYGAYVLSVLPGNYSLTASHPDYESVSLQVSVNSNDQTPVDFQLPLYTVATPSFSPQAGAYSSAVDVTLTCATAEAELRYTLDGSEPTLDSQLYAGAIHLTDSATVKARGFKLNCAPSLTAEAHYDIVVANDDPTAPAVAGFQSGGPNPFGSSLSIAFYLKDSGHPYTLSVYNLRGEVVQRWSGTEKGPLSLNWDGRDRLGRRLASGLYLLRLESGEVKQVRKVVLR